MIIIVFGGALAGISGKSPGAYRTDLLSIRIILVIISPGGWGVPFIQMALQTEKM